MKKILTGAAVLVAAVGSVLAGTAPANAQSSNYGAIAVSLSTGTYGYSYDYPSYSAAEAAAESNCRLYGGGSDCSAKISWRNGCGALAVSSSYFSYGAASTVSSAKNKALANNPGSASIEHWNCTSGYGL